MLKAIDGSFHNLTYLYIDLHCIEAVRERVTPGIKLFVAKQSKTEKSQVSTPVRCMCNTGRYILLAHAQSGNAHELPLLARARLPLLLLVGCFVDVILRALFLDLLADELQSGQVEAHLVLLASQDLA